MEIVVTGGAGTSLARQAKCPHSHARQSGFNRAWATSFTWVLEVEGEGMLCGLCRKHSHHPPKVVLGKTTWVDVPCVTVTQQRLRRHVISSSRLDAKNLEAQLCLTRRSLQQAFTAVESAERKVMKAAMKCLYWFEKQEIPHITNNVGLLELVQSLGTTNLSDLSLGGNAHYTSGHVLQEVMTLLEEVISKSIFDDLRASPFLRPPMYVATVKQVIIGLVPWP